MKTIWMLAAAATLVACGGRGEDDMGAAPDRGDTTAVTTGADTSVTTGVDTSMVQAPADTALAPTTPTDSTALRGATIPVTPSDSGTGAGVDTTGGYGNPPAAVDSTGTSNIPSDTRSGRCDAGQRLCADAERGHDLRSLSRPAGQDEGPGPGLFRGLLHCTTIRPCQPSRSLALSSKCIRLPICVRPSARRPLLGSIGWRSARRRSSGISMPR